MLGEPSGEPNVGFSYASIIRDAQKARWNIDQVLTCVHEIDFHRDLLPEALVHVDALGLPDPAARRQANQIRAHAYLQIFALCERFILPFVMIHAGRSLHTSTEELLALMQFGEEEAKHLALFERFAEAFAFGFGSVCEVVGPADDIAGSVLAEHPLAVALAVLHIEWMTQEHYLRSVRGNADIDAQFGNMLRFHWIEEAQHARIDMLIIEKMVVGQSEEDLLEGVRGYLRIMRRMKRLFRDQVELDIEAYERTGGSLDDARRERWREVQTAAYREAFILAGINHPRFRATVRRCFGDGESELARAARRWVVPESLLASPAPA